MAIIKTKKGEEILVDDDKFDFLSQFTWYVSPGGYARTGIHISDAKRTKNLSMHRLLTHCPSGLVVDHVNGNKLDNQMQNLEIVTSAENNKRAHAMGFHKRVRKTPGTSKSLSMEERYNLMKARSRFFKDGQLIK